MDDNDNSTKSEYELLRERNIRQMEAFFAEDDDTKELAEAVREINELAAALKPQKRPTPKRKRRASGDEAYTFHGRLPTERRRSARLANRSPEQSENAENQIDIELIERRRPAPRQPRRQSNRPSRAPLAVIVPVESITKKQLDNVAKTSSDKIYSPNGTTCHQCRQKTMDTKTFCRSGECVGVRGYFCGPCLRNRYGEEVVVALLDPNWSCPYCRDLCNCSFCQIRRGEAPTGILAPVAFQSGYNSVKDLLEDLNGRGVLPKGSKVLIVDKEKRQDEDDEKFLLGFNEKGEHVLCINCN